MNRIKRAIVALGLVGLLGASPVYAEEKAEAKTKEVSLVEYCKNHPQKYTPKKEAKELHEGLEEIYNNDCHKKKQCDYVIEQLKKVVQIDPNFAEAYHHLGTAFHEKGDYETAIGYLKKAIELEPCSALMYRNLAVSYLNQGRKLNNLNLIQTALNNYKIVISLEPEESELAKKAKYAIENVSRAYFNK